MDSIVLEEPSSSTTACIDRGGGGGCCGGRAIDRHNPIIRDDKRLGHSRIFPTTSTTTMTTDQPRLWSQKPEAGISDQKRKNVAFANDDEFIKPSGFISPASSSRCLLSDHIAMSSFSSEFHHVSQPSPPPPPPPPPPSPPSPPLEHLKFHHEKAFNKKDNDLLSSPPPKPQPPPCDDLKPPQSPPSAAAKPPSPPHPPPSSNQVVVLEVALHCRGCERKMKKHLSKIEGVTSFKIEFAAKRVTVVGDVTPLAVLTSVLKVKNAKLLTPATISSSSSTSQINSDGS